MRASLFLAAFDPMREVPQVCGQCDTNPPVLRYEFRTYSQDGDLTDVQGFCCSACALDLVERLERDEALEWAEEEAALEAEEAEVATGCSV